MKRYSLQKGHYEMFLLSKKSEKYYYICGFEIIREYNNTSAEATVVNENHNLAVSDEEKVFLRMESKTVDNGNILQNPASVLRYQYDNHLGSACLELSDNGDVISYEEYYPFGQTSYYTSSSCINISLKRYRYCGKERDEETGLYYYGMRYYADWLCRFVSVDPLQFKYPELTPFQYASNNPVTMIDLDGAEGVKPEDPPVHNAEPTGVRNQNNELVGTPENQIQLPEVQVKSDTPKETNKISSVTIAEEDIEKWTYTIKDSKFAEYFPVLLKHEGGFVNHPNDPGGATNKGITLNTFKKYAESLLAVDPTLDNLKKLTNEQAAAIYETGYWDKSGAGKISDKQLARLHFDTYVHGGASSVLQHTPAQYSESGKSIDTLNKLIQDNPVNEVFNTYKQERINRFNDLIIKNPKLEVFRKGWINRVNRFQYKTP